MFRSQTTQVDSRRFHTARMYAPFARSKCCQGCLVFLFSTHCCCCTMQLSAPWDRFHYPTRVHRKPNQQPQLRISLQALERGTKSSCLFHSPVLRLYTAKPKTRGYHADLQVRSRICTGSCPANQVPAPLRPRGSLGDVGGS